MRGKPAGYKTLKERAKQFGVSISTIRRWQLAGQPVDDEKKLAAALAKKKGVSLALRERSNEVLAGYSAQTAEDEARVEAALAKTSIGMVEDLEREAARFKRTQAEFEAVGDMDRANAMLKSRMEVYRTVVSIRKELRKLGEDTARTVTRPEVERIVAAMGMQASAAVSLLVDALGKDLLGKDRVEEVAEVLEPALVRGLFLDPFVAAMGFVADSGLPDWVVNAFRRACGDAVENGEAEFDEAVEADLNPRVGNANGETGRREVLPGQVSPTG